MRRRHGRSTGVPSTVTVPLPSRRARAALDLEALYRAARDDVYAYVATLLRDDGAAEDVTALAFERAFRRRRTFDARRGTPRAWLFGIARNAALDELRRRRRSAPLTADVAEADAAAPVEDQVEQLVRRAAVRTATAGLEPREREMIALKFHAGLDNAELAAVLGVSVSNAGTQLHRAMTKLRRSVDARP